MQNKGIFEKTSPQPSLPPRLNLTPDFSTSFLPVARGHREWGLQSIYHKVYFLPPQKRAPYTLPLLQCGIFQGLQVDLCSSHGPPWAAGTQPQSAPQAAEKSLLWHLEHLLPTSSLTLVSAALFLSHVLTPLWPKFAPRQKTFSLLKCAIAAELHHHQWSQFDQQQLHLGADWHWLRWVWGKFLATSHRSHPCRPLPP